MSVIDCDGCAVRGLRCGECVVSVIFGAPPEGVALEDDVDRAVRVLVECGLVSLPLAVPWPSTAPPARRRAVGE